MWSLYKDPDGKNVFEEDFGVPRSSFIDKQSGSNDKAISDSQEIKPVCYNNIIITIVVVVLIF